MNAPAPELGAAAAERTAAPGPARPRRLALAAAAAVVIAAAATTLFLASRGGWYAPLAFADPRAEEPAGADLRGARLRSRLAALAPRGLYLVVDSYANRVRLMRDGELLREMVCSTGSGTVLRDPRTGRLWVFDTPLGERRVERKVRNPVWIKPDWAFIEEGYHPPEDPDLRYDRISLGDYGLYLGDGYIIHGTLFQTLLGRKLTHGCIRLGDDDLKYVYQTVPLGTRVYLY